MAEPKKRSPAFQFYAAEYLADENVELMTLEEEGAYIRAISYCWREGSLPADMDKLSRLLKGASVVVIETVKACFKVSSKDESRLIHPRLDSERVKQANWKKKCATAGKASGKARRAKKLDAELTLNDSSHLVEPTYELNTNSSSSSSSSSSATQKQEQKPAPKAALSSFAVPPSIDRQTWTEFEENRKKLRKPMTDRARKGIVDDLAKLGGDPNALLVQSITRGWAGVFELKSSFASIGGKGNGKGDANLAVLERVLNEDQDGAGADGDVPAGDTRRLDFKTLLGPPRQRAV